jgi:glycosyltransferase involved in cell wall biosynthesis
MSSNSVTVSVIVPCYNYGNYVLDALKSVSDQTFAAWECIIVNDGSTDDSRSVIESYIAGDSRFRLINIPNSGVCVARNTAVAAASGTYLFPLDADNKLFPTCLEKCVLAFGKRPGVRLVYTEARLFGEESGLWALPPFDYKTMLKYNMVDNSCLFLREDFNRVGGYRINMVHGLEDWDLFIALLYGCTAAQVIKIDEPLYYYRVNNAGRRMSVESSGKQKHMLDLMVYNNFAIYSEYFPGIFTRIHAYDFDKTMLNKTPVKALVKGLNFISFIKGKLLGGKAGTRDTLQQRSDE